MLGVLVALSAPDASPARAHDSRPLFIEITEREGERIELRSVAPGVVQRDNAPLVTLGAPCIEISRERSDPRRQRALYSCAIENAAIAIGWPSFNPSISALVRVVYSSGETKTAILDPSQSEWRAPPPESIAGVSRSYFRIGVGHILGGIDHLLFLAGLLIVSGSLRRTLVTITGFTIAHSLTLALVALGLIRVSVAATEAVIALSIVFLATEIARADRTTLAWRRPVFVASAFGLIHGAGFAAALKEIGLPKTEAIAALLFFNVGVEAGQIAIIAAAFGCATIMRRIYSAANPGREGRRRLAAGYALGVISAYWFIERVAALFAAA